MSKPGTLRAPTDPSLSIRRAVQILRQRTDEMIEDRGGHLGCARAAALVDAIDPQAGGRRVNVPAEQPSDTLLDLRLHVRPAGMIERYGRLDRLGLRPASRLAVERQAFAGNRAVGKAGSAIEAVGDR